MEIGKIDYKMTYKEQVFSGIDVTAGYTDKEGNPSILKFHYAYFPDNIYAKAYDVLNHILHNTPYPEDVTNVTVEYR